MTKFKYVGGGAFFEGLPTHDVDDAELDTDGLALLELGKAAGLYVEEGKPTTAEAVFAALAPKPAAPLNPGADFPAKAAAGDDLAKAPQ